MWVIEYEGECIEYIDIELGELYIEIIEYIKEYINEERG